MRLKKVEAADARTDRRYLLACDGSRLPEGTYEAAYGWVVGTLKPDAPQRQRWAVNGATGLHVHGDCVTSVYELPAEPPE